METLDYASNLNAHYGRDGLAERILAAARDAGMDIDHLTPADLAPLDQLHNRGRDATLDLARLAELKQGSEILDIGGGLGGPARTLASEFDCRVTVVDLTEEFCRAGEALTARMGLADRVRFRVANALELPFPDASFDVVWTQHSSMNIAAKEPLYAEFARVLRPNGRLALHEIFAGNAAPLRYPVPWAHDASLSFLAPADDSRAWIRDAGFREVAWHDVTKLSLDAQRARIQASMEGKAPALGIQILLGDGARAAMMNLLANMDEGRAVVIEATFDRASR